MTAAIQRPLRGSRISTFYPVKSLPSLASLDSAFQLQEYISLLIRLNVHDVDSIVSLPGTSRKDLAESDPEKKNEVAVDEACWIYEQLRRLAQDLSHPLITTLQQECNRASCPEMKAGEWLYLCVAHGNDGAMEQCCAIDYILHTVDSATALLNSPRTFPSRLQIPQTSHRHFSSLARRLGRIFAHAYFHHRDAFEQAEAESSLYARFLALTSKFDLVPPEFLVIPPAQFTGDEPGQVPERDLPRGYPDRQQQHNPPQLREEDHNSLLAPPAANTGIGANAKQLAQQQLGVGRRSPPAASAAQTTSSTSSGSPNGGIGDTPSPASMSRFGRSRTDTMVFSEPEANAFAEELAARSRASGADDDQHEEPKSSEDDVIEPIDENEAPFEISLEEEAQVLEDLTAPSDVAKEEEIPSASDAQAVPKTEEPKVEEDPPVEKAPEPSVDNDPSPVAASTSEAQQQSTTGVEAHEPEPQEEEGSHHELTYAEAAAIALQANARPEAQGPTEEDVTDASEQVAESQATAVSPPPAPDAAETVPAPSQPEEPDASEPAQPVVEEADNAAQDSSTEPPTATATASGDADDRAAEHEPAASDISIMEESEVAALIDSDANEPVQEAEKALESAVPTPSSESGPEADNNAEGKAEAVSAPEATAPPVA